MMFLWVAILFSINLNITFSSILAQKIDSAPIKPSKTVEEVWELAIKAKGGRERLYQVNDILQYLRQKDI